MNSGLDLIGEFFATIHNIETKQIKGRRRSDDLFRARCDITRFARACSYTYAEIGRWMNRNHASIIHQMKRSA